MKKFALLIILVIYCMISFVSCTGDEKDVYEHNGSEHVTRNFEDEMSKSDNDEVVVDASLFQEGEYKNENGILTIYNVDNKGFYFKIKIFDKTDKNKEHGAIGHNSENTFAKYKSEKKAVLRGIDTEMTDDEDYNIEFKVIDDKSIVVTESRNDGSKDVINPYSKLGIGFSGVYKKI